MKIKHLTGLAGRRASHKIGDTIERLAFIKKMVVRQGKRAYNVYYTPRGETFFVTRLSKAFFSRSDGRLDPGKMLEQIETTAKQGGFKEVMFWLDIEMEKKVKELDLGYLDVSAEKGASRGLFSKRIA